MSAGEHFGIIGGGMLGMTLALRLAQRGYRVTLLEAADHVGGLADAWELGGVTWDRHYHVTLLSDGHLRKLLDELDLDQHMRWIQCRTGFYVDGRLHSLSSSWEFLRFPPLGLISKLRLAWTIFYASKLKDYRRLETIPIDQWLRKHSGQRTFDRIWLPLLKAKLGDAWQRTSAAFIWATIARLYAARKSGLKREMFGYLPGGYARTLAALRGRLEELGVEVRTGYRVAEVSSDQEGLTVRSTSGEQLAFDRVAVTAAAPLAARLCPQLRADERRRLADVEYLGIVCASLLLKRPLAGYYVTNITNPAPFTGVIEMTALVDPRELGGHTLVYLPKYVPPDDPLLARPEDEIRSEFWSALRQMHPHLAEDDLVAFRVSRVPQVFALSTLGYSERVPPPSTSIPGLFFVNSAQIVNGTLNVNETVRLAEASLETLTRPISQPPVPLHHDAADRKLVARPG